MTHPTKGRRTLATLTMACLGALPLSGAALLATAGSASAIPEHGWCYEEITLWDGTMKTVKVPCKGP